VRGAYLDAGADGVEGEFDDQGDSLSDGGHEEGEDEFEFLPAGDAVDEL
jgi:hypothetical protein